MIPTTRSLEGRWFFWKGTTNRTSTPCFSFICDCSMLGKKFQTYATKWWSKWWFTMVESVKKKVQFEIFLVLFWFLVSDNYNPRLFAEMVWGKGHLVASSCRCSWNFAWRAPNGPQENLAQPGVGDRLRAGGLAFLVHGFLAVKSSTFFSKKTWLVTVFLLVFLLWGGREQKNNN